MSAWTKVEVRREIPAHRALCGGLKTETCSKLRGILRPLRRGCALNLILGELQRYPLSSGLEPFPREARLATGGHKPEPVVGTMPCSARCCKQSGCHSSLLSAPCSLESGSRGPHSCPRTIWSLDARSLGPCLETRTTGCLDPHACSLRRPWNRCRRETQSRRGHLGAGDRSWFASPHTCPGAL